jgi:hypothetical protein
MARPFKRWGKVLLLGSGIPLLVLGLYFFSTVQTQAMFRASEIQIGLAQRNDGGIIFAALLASIGLAFILSALSTRAPLRRILPALAVVASSTLLLAFHFAFFVNGLIMADRSQVMVQASFLFQDSSAIPIEVFALGFATLLVILIGILGAMALLTPQILHHRVFHPQTLQEHRTRSITITLLLLAGGMSFASQFFRWAFQADSQPVGGFITTNVIALYYLLAALVAAGTLLATWRTWILNWGDLRQRTGPRFRRNHRNLIHLENWIWGTVLLLTLIVMNAAAIHSVESVALNQVFATDSHGLQMFFMLVLGIYLLQRHINRGLYTHLQDNRRTLKTVPFDSLLAMSITLILVWTLTPYLVRGPEVTPLIQLLMRTGLATLVILAFALRVDATQAALIAPRHAGLPLLLLTASALAILTGIALWGAGNTVLTVYARESGGFLTPESRFLQPYTVLLRIAGAAFLALPPIMALWLLSAQVRGHTRPGHLIVIGTGTLIAVNLLFTIQATDPFDPLIGRSDVLIGLYLTQLASPLDTLVMAIIWGLATLTAILAVIRIHLALSGARLVTQDPKTSTPTPKG